VGAAVLLVLAEAAVRQAQAEAAVAVDKTEVAEVVARLVSAEVVDQRVSAEAVAQRVVAEAAVVADHPEFQVVGMQQHQLLLTELERVQKHLLLVLIYHTLTDKL
jgi:hypothetical protein